MSHVKKGVISLVIIFIFLMRGPYKDFQISGYVKRSDELSQPKANQENEDEICTAIHPSTKGFYDLRDLRSTEEVSHSWIAKGYDSGHNFTLGICSSPVRKKNHNDEFIDAVDFDLVGGFYTEKGQKYSIGQLSQSPRFRGRKLVLEYHNGSICKAPENSPPIRKSTLISFTCDREILAPAQVSFVGALNDCDYFFEVRTIHACATAAKSENLAAVWIFLLILFSALGVYCSGGFIYKRILSPRRGWRPVNGVVSKLKSAISEA